MSREFDLGDLLLGLDAPNAGAIEVCGDNVCPIVTKACVVHDGGDGKGEFLGGGAGVGDIPKLEETRIDVADVVSADQEGVSIGAEVKGVDGEGDRGLADLCACGGIPEVDDVVAGREQQVLCGVEGKAAHGVGVGEVAADNRACGGIPDGSGSCAGSDGDACAIFGPRDRSGDPRKGEGAIADACGCITEFDLVGVSDGKGLFVGAKGDDVDLGLTGDGLDLGAGKRVPEDRGSCDISRRKDSAGEAIVDLAVAIVVFVVADLGGGFGGVAVDPCASGAGFCARAAVV